jgi:hypothetical protein
VLRNAVVLAVMALAATTTVNWNHGMSGPSRYTIWMLPLVFFTALSLVRRWPIGSRPGAVVVSAIAAAVLSQALIVLARGGLAALPDDLQHSYAATFVLRHAPGLYRPSHEIFTSRTRHESLAATAPLQEPVIYKDGTRCRKAWARPRDRERLVEACGGTPPAYDAFFALGAAEDWRYIDY